VNLARFSKSVEGSVFKKSRDGESTLVLILSIAGDNQFLKNLLVLLSDLSTIPSFKGDFFSFLATAWYSLCRTSMYGSNTEEMRQLLILGRRHG
jgi:hypothetical protein